MPTDEIRQLPYVTEPPEDGRVVLLRPFYDHESRQWIAHLPVGPNEIGRLKGGEPVRGSYYSTESADVDRDLILVLGTFLAQHLSWPRVVGLYPQIESDFCRFCEILEKYDLVTRHGGMESVGGLLSSELEYLLFVVRSLYDLLQRVAKVCTDLIRNLDDHDRRLVANLRDSFARMVLGDGKVLTAEEIAQKYQLPGPIADFYAAQADHFLRIRSIRDAVAHHGADPPPIFLIDEGAAVIVTDQPWSGLPIWSASPLVRERFGSLRAVMAYFIWEAIRATEQFCLAYSSCIAVPPAVGEGINVYLRHPLGHHLVTLERSITAPWDVAEESTD